MDNLRYVASDAMPPMDEATYHRLLDTFLPSEEMRAYLKTQPMLPEKTIRKLIAGSPVPLEEKVKWAWGADKQLVEKALDELNLRPGELFTLEDAWYDTDAREAMYCINAPFLSYEKVLAHIRAEMEAVDDKDWCDSQWYELQKWVPDGDGGLAGVCTYWLLGDQLTYFKLKDCHADTPFNSYCPEPNLPVPFRPGDILIIDCRPFFPVKHALVLEVGDNQDQFCLQALCRDEKTEHWCTGAVKSLFFFRGMIVHFLRYTPVYRLARFTGELSPEEQLLLTAQRVMGSDEAMGTRILNKVNDMNEYGLPRRHEPVTDAELTQLLAEVE